MIPIFKILFDVSFYYALSTFYLMLISGNNSSAWGVVVLLISAVVYLALKSRAKSPAAGKIVKLICSALPGLLLAFELPIWQFIQYLPAWILLGFTIWTNRFYTSRIELEYHFRFTGKILGLAILPFLAVILIFTRVSDAFTAVAPYLIIYLFAGISLMRISREEGKFPAGRNIIILLGLLLGSIALATLLTPQLIQSAVVFIYHNFIVWIIMGIALVFGVIFYGIWLLASRFLSPPPIRDDDGGEGSLVWEDILAEQGIIASRYESPAWLETAAIVFLAIVMAFFMIIIFRKLRVIKIEGRKESYYTEESETLLKSELNKKNKLLRPKDPREAIRWYYRKYLKEGISKGVETLPTDTSLCIWRKLTPLFHEGETWKLRDLYIMARYRFSKEVLKADADAASEIWRRLKN